VPISDRDIQYDTLLLPKIRFQDGFQFAGPPPGPFSGTAGPSGSPTGFIFGPPAEDDPRNGTPLEGGPIKVGGVEAGAAWVKFLGPGAFTSQPYDIEPGSAFEPGLIRTVAAGRSSFPPSIAPPDLPPFPSVEAYFPSVDCNTDIQYSRIVVTGRNHPTLSYWAALAICSGDVAAGVFYYLAANSVADASEYMAEWHIGYVSGGIATPLTSPVAFQSVPVLPNPKPDFTMSLEVAPDGGTGVDLKVRGYDWATATPFTPVFNDASPADPALLTGKKVGIGGTALASTVGPVELVTWWNGGDL
jgi:hypothetical protein